MASQNNLFSLRLPDAWEDRTAHLFMGPEDSGVQHNLSLVVDDQASGLDLDEYAEERIEALKESIPDIEILKQEGRNLDNGTPVYECVYKWVPVDGRVIFNKVVYMLIDDVGYTFSANFSKKTIKTIGVEVNRIIESFRPGLPVIEND